jgi:hypothetical protein
VAPKLANHNELEFVTRPFLWQIAIERDHEPSAVHARCQNWTGRGLRRDYRTCDWAPIRPASQHHGLVLQIREIGRWLWRQTGEKGLRLTFAVTPFDIEAEDWLGAKSYPRFGWSLQMHRPLLIFKLKISLTVTDNEWQDKQEPRAC